MADWRRTREYGVWRAIVIRRDKVCQVCGSRKYRQAHHENSGQYFPLERFNPVNGVCLCRSCHIDAFHSKFMGGTRKKTTKADLDRFYKLIKILLRNRLNIG